MKYRINKKTKISNEYKIIIINKIWRIKNHVKKKNNIVQAAIAAAVAVAAAAVAVAAVAAVTAVTV